MQNLITDISGLRIGHADDAKLASGVSAIVFDHPVISSISVLGGAPGGRDTGLLEPEMSVETVDAILLSGGSAFGLDAAGGAMAALKAMGRGFAVGEQRVPIVPQAILFDLLNGGDKNWGDLPPYWALGKRAIETACHQCPLGSVGAGLGATTANLKGGIGSASAMTTDGVRVGALVAVNAIGTATIGDKPHFWAAPYEQNAEFGGLGWPQTMPPDALMLRIKGHAAAGDAREPATTIGMVVTDAILTKAQAKRLAIMAQDGLARAIRPAHAPMDGDTIFAAATGLHALKTPMKDLTQIGMLAADCVARAIARGVYHAKALQFSGAIPSWNSRFGNQNHTD